MRATVFQPIRKVWKICYNGFSKETAGISVYVHAPFLCALKEKSAWLLNLTNVIFNMKSYVSKINKNSKDGNVNKISKNLKN